MGGNKGGGKGGGMWVQVGNGQNVGAILQAIAGGGFGGGWGGGGNWGGGKKFKADKSGGELGEFKGEIKSFVYKKYYGFIECPELAEYGDVFLHGDELRQYKKGQTVKFTAVLNKDGKAQ